MAIPIAIGAINVNHQDTNSSISVGENQLTGWSAHRKTNNGFAQQSGIITNTLNYTIIIDNDLSDGNILDPDFIPGAQAQVL
ncbi:hypothetical protein [Neobacillus niacini]|uniref:hypothetical protein n=1 Tax=Neobacillus niacini TaxID=86668 RepID=UPI0021CB49C3|nr:hypothetical protein [Neobacillus niacini]MCM3768482.1 hypothetical protein [Neobacillus niacini]